MFEFQWPVSPSHKIVNRNWTSITSRQIECVGNNLRWRDYKIHFIFLFDLIWAKSSRVWLQKPVIFASKKLIWFFQPLAPVNVDMVFVNIVDDDCVFKPYCVICLQLNEIEHFSASFIPQVSLFIHCLWALLQRWPTLLFDLKTLSMPVLKQVSKRQQNLDSGFLLAENFQFIFTF